MKYYLQVLLLVGILVLANLISSGFFTRVDLTAEGRYSLTPLTKQTLSELPDVANVRVYLAGKLPLDVERFRQSIEALLQEMKAYGGEHFHYEFIDVEKDANPELKKHLTELGIQPIVLNENADNLFAQYLVFPAALVNYKGEETVVDFLRFDCESGGRGRMQCDYTKAESEVEYRLVSALRRVVQGKKRLIGILTTNSEYSPDRSNVSNRKAERMLPFIREMGHAYRVMEVRLDSTFGGIPPTKEFLPDSIKNKISGDGFDLLILPQPAKPFTERQKYEIDQYFMRGGRLMILGDMAEVQHDDFTEHDRVISLTRNTNLDDLLLKYGVKINTDLLEEASPQLMWGTEALATVNGHPQMMVRPWPFFPVLKEFATHSITQNIDAIALRYASTLDTLRVPNVSHKVLAISSPHSRALNSPVEIAYTELLDTRRLPPPSVFRGKGDKPMVVLSEGMFESLYDGRPAPTDELNPNPPTAVFTPRNVMPNKLLVIGDGDIMLNDHLRHNRDNFPVDNLAFMLNSVDYMINDTTYAGMRAKNVVARKLNETRVMLQATEYRFLNLVVPVLLVIIGGFARYYLRKRANSRLRQLSSTAA